MDVVELNGRRIAPGEPPYVIAEIGANHNGDMDLCARLIESAAECGADAVKFQSWSRSTLFSEGQYRRDAQRVRSNGGGPTLQESVEQYQLSHEQHRLAARWCREAGITFMSSAFAPAEVDMLVDLDVPAIKLASMDVTHLPLLEYVAGTGLPILLSTGMATLGEVERALDTLRSNNAGPVVLLHCVSIYPTPPEQVHLRTMATWSHAFDVPVGYSDHTMGVAVPLAAVALGACVIEKHFTLDKSLPGWDHAISADPAELRAITSGARDVHAALGHARRVVGDAELQKRLAFRRCMVARRPLRRGERLTNADVDFKRPGNGIQPDELSYVLGRALLRDVDAESELSWGDLQ
ncbi:MAG: N-acetylneuraminate synthase family protein [Gemmatirosa sp.]